MSGIFEHIDKIGEICCQAGGVNDLFYEFAKPHLDYLCRHLQLSKTGSALFAVMINLFDGDEIPITKLTKHLNCKLLDVLTYIDEFEILEQRGLVHIFREKEDFGGYRDRKKLSFELRFNTIDNLRKGSYENLFAYKNLTIEKFFLELERIFKECVHKRQSYSNTILVMNNLLNENNHLLFVQKIQKLSLHDDDKLILLRFFHYYVNNDNDELDFRDLTAVYSNLSDSSFLKRKLRLGNYVLLEKELIEYFCNNGFNDTETFRLTDEAKEEYLVELNLAELKTLPKNLKRYDSIAEKKMFYPEKTQLSIDELGRLLEKNNFDDIRNRLSENGMRNGFACLFSGVPGTGKTETVYQIAKKTNRDIFPVDIACTKSKWFGDSEKLIKNIFDKYRSCVKNCETIPILLLNEADAILGKRRLLNENHSGPGQTENAIQNIILQEIENLNGILIATTNLTGNLDAAFERRFIYKIEFTKPDADTRAEIWKSLIPWLSDNDAVVLAARFDFSGGQIENIARKTTVHKVLSGDLPDLDSLMKYCSEENFAREAPRLGFCINS